MERVSKISDSVVTLLLSLLYISIISKVLNFDLISAFKNDFNDSIEFYYMGYFTYFLITIISIFDSIFFRYRLKLIDIKKESFNKNTMYIIWIILAIITHIIFLRNLLIGDYHNLMPTTALLLMMMIQAIINGGIFITDDYIIANRKKYYFDRIKAAIYTDTLKICIETDKKDYFIIALSNERYSFIQNIIDENIQTTH